MFQVDQVILSSQIAEVKFACNVSVCKGACCFVGDSGAPVEKSEIPVLQRAYRQLKSELRSDAVETIQREGLVLQNSELDDETNKSEYTYQLNCTDGEACVFVTYNGLGVAECAIQKAYFEERYNWEKPISCHLFPLRIKKIGGFEYVNYQYVPSLCESACDFAEKEGIWLSDFVEVPLTRKYGKEWYEAFSQACKELRIEGGLES